MAANRKDFFECAVLVTGAASGIGRASAVAFAEAGAEAIAIVDVDEPGLTVTADLLRARGVDVKPIRADVADPRDLTEAFAAARRSFGRLDIIHNNAGILSGEPAWPYTSIERIAEVVNVNVCGTLMGTRLGIDALAGYGGAIVSTASVAGLAPMPADPIYAATKAAIISFTQSCQPLAKSHQIWVNAVLPGLVDSAMISKSGPDGAPAGWIRGFALTLELLEPARVAAAVVELALDRSTSGQTVVLDNLPAAQCTEATVR